MPAASPAPTRIPDTGPGSAWRWLAIAPRISNCDRRWCLVRNREHDQRILLGRCSRPVMALRTTPLEVEAVIELRSGDSRSRPQGASQRRRTSFQKAVICLASVSLGSLTTANGVGRCTDSHLKSGGPTRCDCRVPAGGSGIRRGRRSGIRPGSWHRCRRSNTRSRHAARIRDH